MARVYNFSAGPSMLPEKVLKQAQAELLEYGDSGQSVMEMSHRSARRFSDRNSTRLNSSHPSSSRMPSSA